MLLDCAQLTFARPGWPTLQVPGGTLQADE
jgi:hypothetical protein